MTDQPLNIVHVFRAPVGGLFRHVRDAVQVQAALGHRIGIVCDASSGGEAAEVLLRQLAPHCALGIHRLTMSRAPGLGDMSSARKIVETCGPLNLDIVHGHGAKGGAYARMSAARLTARAVYTPHGGALHYSWRSPQGAVFLAAERVMLARTSGLAFVCEFERRCFADKIGLGKVASEVIHNGLWSREFAPVQLNKTASDLLFIGELRTLKGIDTLIEAIAMSKDRPLTATIVGDGADRQALEALVAERGLSDQVSFTGALQARKAFALGRVLVVPSRKESFPYVVLEAIAAAKPVVATNVGGIPEVIDQHWLVEPDDPAKLAQGIERVLMDSGTADTRAHLLGERVRKRFRVEQMGEKLIAFYGKLLDADDAVSRVA